MSVANDPSETWAVPDFRSAKALFVLLFSQPDLIIATTALHHGLTIVTRNLSDDQRVRTPVFNPRVDPLSASAS